MKKRFITVAVKFGDAAVVAFSGSVAAQFGNDAYQWAKSQLQKKGIPHQDTSATTHRELPHQGGFVSFYQEPNGKWMRVDH